MKRTMKVMLVMALLMVTLLSALPAHAAQLYVVESSSPNGYCYLYSNASDRDGISRNLGRYNNGSVVYVIDYYGGKDGKYIYCYVQTMDGKYGYMHDYALTRYTETDLTYVSFDGPEYYVYSTSPNGYCYLYSEPSDINGRNLGRYDNYEMVKVIDYYGGSHGRYNYCKVITWDDKVGYIHDYALQYCGW